MIINNSQHCGWLVGKTALNTKLARSLYSVWMTFMYSLCLFWTSVYWK